MDNKTVCEIFEASERASDLKKSFMCAQESLHDGLVSSPWPIFIYALSVIFIAFLAAAFLTPPDPFSQISLALPIIILYEITSNLYKRIITT